MILSESPGAQLRSHPHDPILLFLCFSFSVLLITVSLFEIPTFDSHSLCICFSLIILNNYLIFSYFWADVTAFTTFIFLEKCQIPLSSVASFFSLKTPGLMVCWLQWSWCELIVLPWVHWLLLPAPEGKVLTLCGIQARGTWAEVHICCVSNTLNSTKFQGTCASKNHFHLFLSADGNTCLGSRSRSVLKNTEINPFFYHIIPIYAIAWLYFPLSLPLTCKPRSSFLADTEFFQFWYNSRPLGCCRLLLLREMTRWIFLSRGRGF